MSKIALYNFATDAKSEAELPADVFDIKASKDLIYQAVVRELANRRNTVAHTKTRGEVRGGGKKPWKQKGTGRARVGSIRSPIWKGGGVIFGPRSNRNFSKDLNRPQFRKALFATLTQFQNNGTVYAYEGLALEKINTKALAAKFATLKDKLSIAAKSFTVIISKIDDMLQKSARNLPNVEILTISQISPYTLLKTQTLVFSKDALDALPKHFQKKA